MTTEDYVSFETAKLLKEKGFDVYVHSFYDADDMPAQHNEALWDWNLNKENYRFSAPTLQMTMKWLREVHNIHINLDIHWLYFANSKGWMYTIERILENGIEYVDSKGDENDKTFYLTYEEACEAGIRHCLENLI